MAKEEDESVLLFQLPSMIQTFQTPHPLSCPHAPLSSTLRLAKGTLPQAHPHLIGSSKPSRPPLLCASHTPLRSSAYETFEGEDWSPSPSLHHLSLSLSPLSLSVSVSVAVSRKGKFRSQREGRCFYYSTLLSPTPPHRTQALRRSHSDTR
jgi:hypothetical protein